PQRQNHRSIEPYKPATHVTSPGDYEWQSSRRNAPSSFEDMMSKFKQTSEDKMSDLKRGGESRGYSRRGNGNGRK
ncbi:MAG: RNA-binding protein S1, partial [Ruminococcus sp.]|nr:RNA-binding protein S1 [Ruminococcus sp.]